MTRFMLVAAVMFAGVLNAQDDSKVPEPVKPVAEHAFLKQFAGDWDCETECFMPGAPPDKSKGSVSGTMIGDLWAVLAVKGNMGGMPYIGQGTFGYDPEKKVYVGTWVDSMSNYLWKYEGKVEGNKLIFNAEGPCPMKPGKLSKFRDTWEFKGKDQLVLTGEMEGDDGKMAKGMVATCTRKR
jgi:hypothetical protein